MPENYYSPTNTYPPVVYAVVERIKLYTCSMLYPDETYAASKNRFILANFESGQELAVRKTIETFKTSQGRFPFTAYNVGEMTPVEDKRSHWQKNHKFYDKYLNCYISSQPTIIEIPMMSFFTSAYDYMRCRTLLADSNANLTRLITPITVNDILTSFTIDVNFEIAKFSLAFEFEEFLRVGRIFDIQHTMSIYFHNLVVDGNLYPVEDIEFSLATLSEIDRSLSPDVHRGLISTTPEITSTAPTEGETDIDRDNPVVINFSEPMLEYTVESSISTVPFISADLIWNSSGTILVIDPVAQLSSGTLYSIVIDTGALSVRQKPLEEDFTLNFTTGAE